MNSSINQQLEPKQKPNLDQTVVIQVEKRSSSKMFWNKRVLTLKEGILSYFSKVPKQPSDLSKLQPKISVYIENILYIGPAEKPKKHNSLEITFMAKDAIKKGVTTTNSVNQSINSSYGKELMAAQQPIVITKKKEVIIWEISFSKPDQLKDFLSNIEKLRHPAQVLEEPEQKKEAKLPEPMDQESQEKIRQLEEEKKVREGELMEQQKAQREYQLKMEQEMELQRIKQEQEQKARKALENQLQVEKQQLQKQLEEQRRGEDVRRQIIEEKMKFAWNYNFIQAIELAHIKDPQTIEDTIQNSFIMHESIAAMTKSALEVSKTIIEELSLPNSYKKIKPTMSVNEDKYLIKGSQQLDDSDIGFGEDFYVYNGFIIKLAYSQLKKIKIFLKSENKEKNIQIYDETSIKALGNEFRYLSLLANQIEQQLQEDSNYPLRVPLCNIVDYRGIRAFVLAIPPISELMQGPTSNGQYQTNNAIQQYMTNLSASMNLKPHKMYFDDELIANNIPLSLFAEVHSMLKDEFIEFRWVENTENQPDFPPQNLNLYYITKCADLMPLEVDIEKDIKPTKRLRPEYIRTLEKPLNSDAFLSEVNTQETQNDDQEVSQAGINLKERVILMVKKLESLQYMPFDSNNLTQLFHKEGLNMRLLGQVCTLASYQHIKESCVNEMISRVCKKVLRNNLADLQKNLKSQLNQRLLQGEDVEYSMIQNLSLDDLKNVDKIKIQEQTLTNESTLDFLNLILGVGKESDIFWNQIVQKQIWYDYGFYFDASSRFNIQAKGMLIVNLCQQCDIECQVTPELVNSIFRESFPLKQKIRFIPRRKYFSLQSSRISKKARRKFVFKHKNNEETILQSHNWALELARVQDEVYTMQEMDEGQAIEYIEKGFYHADSVAAMHQLIRIYFEQNDQEKALQIFEQALITLETHLGQSHPAYSTLYSIMAHYLKQQGCYEDALNLFNSSLTCLQRVLDPDHPQVAEILTDIGQLCVLMKQNQNGLQYYLKSCAILQQHGQYESIEYARCLLYLGKFYLEVQKLEQAAEYTQNGIEILEQHEYEFTDQLINGLQLLLQIYVEMKNELKIYNVKNQIDLLLMRHNIYDFNNNQSNA